jgi:hypothetical protein
LVLNTRFFLIGARGLVITRPGERALEWAGLQHIALQTGREISSGSTLSQVQNPLRKMFIKLFCGFIVFVMPSSLRNWRARVRTREAVCFITVLLLCSKPKIIYCTLLILKEKYGLSQGKDITQWARLVARMLEATDAKEDIGR